MVRMSVEQIREIMNSPERVRNISIIAHVDHGKTTLTDSLLARAGLISDTSAGNACSLDAVDPLGKASGITIKSTGVSLGYELLIRDTTSKVVVNLIDSPGHVDFSCEVSAALRVTDGALVVVDSVEGKCVQTETVLRQAMQEKVRPVLIINKLDRQIVELQAEPEVIYQNLNKIIESLNSITMTYDDPDLGETLCFDPRKGNVAFGSGKDCWGFTLATFARIYSKKFGISEKALMNNLWGDNFYDQTEKKWYKEPKNSKGEPLKRGFCAFILEPVTRIIRSITQDSDNGATLEKMLVALNIDVKQAERNEVKTKKELLKLVMSRWIHVADAVLEMIFKQLPSPQEAQLYRTKYLYEGPIDDIYAESIKNCDPKGPLVVYISKLVPTTDRTRFFVFGRVFSGTVASGQKVHILGPNYTPGKKNDLYIKNITRTLLTMGKSVEYVGDIPAGNICCLAGLDQFILKNATLTDNIDAFPIRKMKYSVSPVVRVAIQPKKAAELPRLIEGLQKLTRSDQLVTFTQEETGQLILCGSGELHIEMLLANLRDDYAGIEIETSEPIVSYRETVSKLSSQICLAKTGNKLNRFFCTAEPLDEELCKKIEAGEIGPGDDKKTRKELLVNEFKWEPNEAMKISCFGPENTGPNVLVNKSVGMQYFGEVEDSLQGAFQWVCKEGVLAGESLRGVKINFIDGIIHEDPRHRGPGQAIPAARRVFYSSCLTAQPKIQEPIFLCEIQAPKDTLGIVYNCLTQKKATIIEEEDIEGTPMAIVKSYLPVAESFGFSKFLRSETSGQAFPQCVFSHWGLMSGDALDLESKQGKIVSKIRQRKGLKDNLPRLDEFLDKL